MFLRGQDSGFSLVELSIILTIISLVAISMMEWMTPAAENEARRLIITQERMKQIKKALYHYRIVNNRLPHPSTPTLADLRDDYPSNNIGREDFSISVGVVPVREIGLDFRYMNDGWGNRFTYAVAVDGVNSSAADARDDYISCTDCVDVWKMEGTTPHICSGAGTNCQLEYNDIRFVIISHGANGYGAYLGSGVKFQDSTETNELENADGDNVFVSSPYNQYFICNNLACDEDQQFDDIVLYGGFEDIENDIAIGDRILLSFDECTDKSASAVSIAKALDDISSTAIWNQINTEFSSYLPGITAWSSAKKAAALLFYTQEICSFYYRAPYSANDTQRANDILNELSTPTESLRGCIGGKEYSPLYQYCE